MPGRPTITEVTPGDGKVTVAFNAPSVDGGRAITHYVARLEPEGQEKTATDSPFVFEGLTNGTPYTVSLAAVNSQGQSAYSTTTEPCTPGEL